MKAYTLGFIFNSSLDSVLLIHKTHPDWQKGKINGLGGKIEQGEESLDCMVREIEEEAGLKTEKALWMYAGKMYSDTWNVDVYSYIHEGKPEDAESREEEKVEWFQTDSLPPAIHSNLSWLIPQCLDQIKNKKFTSFSVEYKE